MNHTHYSTTRSYSFFSKYLLMGLLLLCLQRTALAQGGNECASLTPTFINYEPCKYRLRLVNTTECIPSITLLLPAGSYTSFSGNTAGGWTATEVSSGEILLTHAGSFVPIGTSFPLLFTLDFGGTVEANLNYPFTCGQGVSCTFIPGFTLESCPDPENASIIGVKYRECNASPYSNQSTISGWPIQLLAEDNQTVVAETETDAGGGYTFYDLPKGQYIVKEASKPGWTSNVPANGQYTVNLEASQQVTRNFGNCPACSCDSIYTEVVQIPGALSTCTYSLNVSSTAPAGCFTQLNISTSGGAFNTVTGTTGWNAVLVSPQQIQVTYTGGFIPPGVSQPCFFTGTSSGSAQSFEVTTTYTSGGVTQTCTRAAGPFQCPPPVSPPPCCPQGNTWGPELVVNPDFQGGYTGFTNGYTAVPAGSPMTAGNASVANQTQTYASNNQWGCLDHTTYSAPGLFLVVDGYAAPVVWQQSVSVTAGTTYSFYAWFNNLVIPTRNYADPTVTLWVNGNQVAGPLTLTEMDNQWKRLCGTYTAQQTGSVTLSIQMAAGSSLGNDLGIDDISFRACVPPNPCQVSINVTPVNNCGLVTVTATTVGPQPVSYQWCNGSVTNTYTAQLPCGPHTFCVTATCADGTTSTASVTYVVSDPIPPTCVAVPGFGVALNQNCTYTLTPQQIDGGSTDNCQIQNLSISPTVLTGCGVTTVTLTVTDWCGNTSTCTTGIQTIETVPPVITNCPTTPVPVQTNLGLCYYTGPLPVLTATDNCGTVTNFTCSLFNGTNFIPITPATQFPKGNNTIRCTATDNCNNTSQSCTYTLLVEDKEKPTIVCPQNVYVIGAINPAGLCKAVVNNIAAIASDNCPMLGVNWQLSGATIGQGIADASGTMFMQGTTTVTYTALDMAGNSSTCSFTVNVSCGQWACDCQGTPGPELIVNGNFQAGSTGFLSDYLPLLPSCSPKEFLVTDPIQAPTVCNNWASSDHTTGNLTAGWLFFAADGSLTPTDDAWYQAVTLTAGQTYNLCAWVKNLNYQLDRPDPIVEAYILDASQNPIGGPIATTGPLLEAANPSLGWTQMLASYTATSPGTHYVAFRSAGTSFEGNNFALDDISFRACTPQPPACTCPPNAFTNMSYKQNSGPNVPIACGQVAIWQCQFPTFNLSGNFMCQGNNCPATIPMSWVLKNGVNIPVDNGSMTGPGFLVSIPNSSFATSGVYTLTLMGICGTDTCFCDIKIETPGCGNGCTCPPNAFTNMSYKQNSGPNVPIACGQVAIWQCQFPTFNLSGNFMCQGNNCPATIPMSWVLKNGANVPVDNGSMTGPGFLVSIPNSSFATSGVYTLTLMGICGTDTCFCDIKIETPGCGGNCSCGQVTWAQFYRTWDWNQPITCNNFNNPLKVPCLKQGQNYFVHGDFPCSAASCAGAVTWTLTRPSLPSVSGTASGPYPHFDIFMAGGLFTQPGIYTLVVTRACGSNLCNCTFVFEVVPCRCECSSLPPLALQSFNVAGSIFSCKRTFAPVAPLCANDQVLWFVNFSFVGTTTGNAPFMYNFPSGGGYWVCMLVVRTDPFTGQVCYYAKCRWIKVKCLTFPNPTVCEANVVKNGDFSDGASPGELDGDGALADWEWFPNQGNGSVFVDSTAGGNDSGFLVFSGGQDNFGAVYQQVDLSSSNNFINLEYEYFNLQGEELPAGSVLEFRLHAEPTPGSLSQVLYTHPISTDTSESGWRHHFVSLPMQINPDFQYLIVCCRNTDQNRQSLVALDNLTICGSGSLLTETKEVSKNNLIRLFPNPNTGAFTVELPEPATPDLRFRVIDLTGRITHEQAAQSGHTQQTIQSSHLPAGLYFLQVLSDGKVLATEKFVKE